MCIVAGMIGVIGGILAWYNITPNLSSINLGVNPLYGVSMMGIQVIQTMVLTKISGAIAIVGAALIFGVFWKPKIALIGGIITIAGAALFVVFLLVEGVLPYGAPGVSHLPLFGSVTDPTMGDVTCYLTYGFF
ncbi:MAG: hypothetical protein ACTSQQ_06190 [Candidatus Helarchaeota archaeon]